MGKYLQDVMFHMPTIAKKGFTEEKRKAYDERYSHLIKPITLIETLYNFYLPIKYETGYNIWRFVIWLEELTNPRIEEVGHVADYIQPFNNDLLSNLSPQIRKEQLLELFQSGIVEICKHYNSSSSPFSEIYNKIRSKGIVLSEIYRETKLSPNRQYIAKLHTYYSEEDKYVSLLIESKTGTLLQKIKISEKCYLNFDKITWIDNDKLKVSYINQVKSYKSKKVSEDYFEVSLNGQVKYVPLTREGLFDHALELICLGEDKMDEAISLLSRAQQAGHGKAKNILDQLEINAQERNLLKLKQAPKKRL